MRILSPIVVLAAIFAFAAPVAAQQPWAAELRVGGAFPTVDVVGDLGTGNGVSLEGVISYRFIPFLGAYLAWDDVRFSPENSFAGPDVDFLSTGYTAGLRFEHPLTEAVPVGIWLRAGVRYDYLKLEDAANEIIAGTERDVGFEIGGGVAIPLTDGWVVTPGARFRAATHDVQISPSRTEEAQLRHVVVDLGVLYHLPF